ncbi:MAG: hypothetical protein OEL20_04990 [Sulfuritalea sp.]|nr:hypothetical protein [Sulfuritalea sp.]
MIQALIDLLQAKIAECGLEVLSRYPDDLLVHDRAMLERHAFPGATLAWMVGHCHTHFCVLGIHPEENVGVTYLTNLAAEDRFFVITVGAGHARLTELDRQAFSALATTPVLYKADGTTTDYWLSRRNGRVGHIALEPVGGWQDRSYRVSITPISGISEMDRGALQLWGSKSVAKASGSLFTRFEIEWQPAVAALKAA